MLRRVVLIRTDVSEECSTSITRVTRIVEIGTRRIYFPLKHRFLQDLYVVTSQKTAFFVVTAVKTSNLTDADMSPKCPILQLLQLFCKCPLLTLTHLRDYEDWRLLGCYVLWLL
jgi:hypothetical protein